MFPQEKLMARKRKKGPAGGEEFKKFSKACVDEMASRHPARGFAWAALIPAAMTLLTSWLQKCLDKDDPVDVQDELRTQYSSNQKDLHERAVTALKRSVRKARKKAARERGIAFNHPSLREEFTMTPAQYNEMAGVMIEQAVGADEEAFSSCWSSAQEGLVAYTMDELSDNGV
jgi:1,4-alpha-glucan branching enzyme